MKLLILTQDYPDQNGRVAMGYVHSRNVWYKNYGIEIDVLSFSTNYNYSIDEINVYDEQTVANKLKDGMQYDAVISHAPNIKNHYRFLRRNNNLIDRIIFFFHGHEVLKGNDIYPQPYDYVKQDKFYYKILKNFYDKYKLFFWERYFNKNSNKIEFVFVSRWMKNKFSENIKIKDMSKKKSSIIYNCIGKQFEENEYNPDENIKEYDFITIRNDLDGSKYAIDIVNNLAKKYPKYSFLVVGKGEFFKHNKKAFNITWKNINLGHDDIITYLNKARCALMPTRADAQGVMACEIASIGMPLITSNIEVCQEIFNDFENVYFIENTNPNIDYINTNQVFDSYKVEKNKKFYFNNTIQKELKKIKKTQKEL